MADDTARRDSFDAMPELYARARPGYPEAVFDAVCEFAAVGPGSRALEIGCGPGQATVPMARRGLAITAIEIGANMARYAASRTAGMDVRVHTGAFEDWPLPEQPFDLVYSASAFHWIAPEARYVRTAALLRRGGALALFWNRQTRADDDGFAHALQAVYEAEAPELCRDFRGLQSAEQVRVECVGDLETSGLFGPIESRLVPWEITFTARSYSELLSTYSDHATLPDDRREQLLAAVRRLIDDRWGGTVRRPWVTALYLARTISG